MKDSERSKSAAIVLGFLSRESHDLYRASLRSVDTKHVPKSVIRAELPFDLKFLPRL